MIYIYTVMLGILSVLFVIGIFQRSGFSGNSSSISKPFLGTAVLLHRCVDRINAKSHKRRKKNKHYISANQLAKQLQTLNPGELSETQLYRFRIERTSTMILILFIATLIALLISFTAVENKVLEEGNLIYRNTFGGVDIVTNLTAGIEKNEKNQNRNNETKKEYYDVEIKVPSEKYTGGEALELFEQLSLKIDDVLKAENESLSHIVQKINLPKSVEGYPFSISWECSNYSLIDMDGQIHNEDLTDEILVDVIGDFSYEGKHWYLVRTLTICPKEYTREELVLKNIEEELSKSDELSKTEQFIVLPNTIGEDEISWNEDTKDNSYLILALGIVLCILMIPLKESEVKSELKKRNQQLLISYPMLVSKIILYIGAGMSVRNSLIRMGKEYELSRKTKKDFLGMEIMITAHELEMGISESEALIHLGQRCGTKEYLKLTSLMVQNLKKGSTDLIRLLEGEAAEAFEMRKNVAKKLGEEASTKLLVPMILMLGVVMVIIMIPAYMSFS